MNEVSPKHPVETELYEKLTNLNIPYIVYEHPPIFTVEDGLKYKIERRGGKTKNLFLRNKKKTQYYLITVEGTKRADLKKIAHDLNESTLSFGSPEDLERFLGVQPGSVTALALFLPSAKELKFYLDQDLAMEEFINFHPLRNTATVELPVKGFQDFVLQNGHQINLLQI